MIIGHPTGAMAREIFVRDLRKPSLGMKLTRQDFIQASVVTDILYGTLPRIFGTPND